MEAVPMLFPILFPYNVERSYVEQHSLILTIDGMVYNHYINQDETLPIRYIIRLK